MVVAARTRTRLNAWWLAAHGLLAATAVGGCGRWGFDALSGRGADDPRGTAGDDASGTIAGRQRSGPSSGVPIDAATAATPPSDAGSGDATAPRGGPSNDASSAQGTAADAATATRCTSGTFGTPELVTGFGLSPSLYAPKPSSDGAVVLFTQVPGADDTEDIFVATRTAASTVSTAIPLANINTDFQDGTPFMSLDGLTLMFSSTRSGLGSRDLWLATRASSTDDFSVVRNLTELNSTSLDHSPSMTADALTVFFTSDRDTGNAEDIYAASRASPSDDFGTPSKVMELDTTWSNQSAFVSPDGLSLYFVTDRPMGAGCTDVWIATRASTAVPFSAATPLNEVNSPDCEEDPSLSADGCELWLSSSRGGNGFEIYHATRTQ